MRHGMRLVLARPLRVLLTGGMVASASFNEGVMAATIQSRGLFIVDTSVISWNAAAFLDFLTFVSDKVSYRKPFGQFTPVSHVPRTAKAVTNRFR